jgi:hypothetical protein
MIDKVNKDVVSTLMKGHIPISEPSAVQKAQAPKRLDLSKFQANKRETPGYNDPSGGPDNKKAQPVRVDKKWAEMIPVLVEVVKSIKIVTVLPEPKLWLYHFLNPIV